MSDDTTLFLNELAGRGHEPLLARVTGTARIELVEGGQVDRWRVTIDHGDVVVSPDDGVADCSIRATKDLFDAICRGEENAVAAVLRGALVCTGDVELLFAIQRLFPGPPGGGKTVTAGAAP